jgi:nucleoredoxin
VALPGADASKCLGDPAEGRIGLLVRDDRDRMPFKVTCNGGESFYAEGQIKEAAPAPAPPGGVGAGAGAISGAATLLAMPQLLSKAGGAKRLVATAAALAGKAHVLVFFSAHWCPPSRSFTPVLAAWAARNAERLNAAVVFLSYDRSEGDFDAYFDSMGAGVALAAPYGNAGKDRFADRFHVTGIPTVLVFNADGELITTDGRGGVTSDAGAERFPWGATAASAARLAVGMRVRASVAAPASRCLGAAGSGITGEIVRIDGDGDHKVVADATRGAEGWDYYRADMLEPAGK